jgi:predicted HD phosphohydrolase
MCTSTAPCRSCAACLATVLDPIKLHVDAKRYLCATRPDYFAGLSEDSKRSLALQGGIFRHRPGRCLHRPARAADAVRLRIWDDLAKGESGHPTVGALPGPCPPLRVMA